jgi:SNF family Na+-dependent transporter
MKRFLQFIIHGGLAFLTVATVSLFTFGLTSAQAETFVGSNVDSRVILAFHVNENAAQAWLPDGWMIASLLQRRPPGLDGSRISN